MDYYFISLWSERNVFLLGKVHSTNLEKFTWLFICGTNWLFCGTNWPFCGTIWLLIGTIWLWNEMTVNRIWLEKVHVCTIYGSVWGKKDFELHCNIILASPMYCIVLQLSDGINVSSNSVFLSISNLCFWLPETSKERAKQTSGQTLTLLLLHKRLCRHFLPRPPLLS